MLDSKTGLGSRELDCERSEPIDEELPSCQTCGGSGEVFVRRDSRGRIDYIDGSPTSETTRCDMCNGEGVRS